MGGLAMWECPKCARTFKNTNQNHFCEAEKSESIDDYIAEQAEEVRPILEKVREVIREAAPNAKEKISWKMPTFWQGENLVHFCAQTKHLGIYPGVIENLSDELRQRLDGYKTTKGAIQFPYNKPIDYELIADITKWHVSVAEEGES
jgi:uncharacterized protein YdhG (YjbR/CyaY superfamily)